MKSEDFRGKVIHFHDTFFKISETFVRRQISYHSIFYPIAVCFRFINQELRPLKTNVIVLPRIPIDILRSIPLFTSPKISYLISNFPSFYEVYFKYLKTLKKCNKLLIQTHFGNNAFFTVRLKRALKVPLSVYFYGVDVTVLTRRHPKIYKYIAEDIDIALTTSYFLKMLLESVEFPQKVIVNRLGVDISEIRYKRRPLNIDLRKSTRILNIGRLVEFKGHEYLIMAHKMLRDKGYNIETFIIGDGPRKKMLQYLINKYELSKEIKLLGNLSFTSILNYLYSSDIFVFPSVVCRDGSTDALGYACVEAMACGLPVVASSVGGIPEYVIHNETGLLVNQRDPRQIVEALEELINNPKKAKQLSFKARKKVEIEFNIKSSMKNLELLYVKFLES